MSEPIRVLHVDDDPDFAEMAADFLEREDGRIEVATEMSISGGLERLTSEEFDCIISDYDMPRRDGLVFLERVRDKYDDLPFILYTGKGSEEVASEALSAGATDYLQKEAGTDQYTILANRVINSVETARTKQQRQRQLDAIETAQEGISILDEEGQFIYINEAYADLYQYDPEDMIGEHWELIYPDDDVEVVREEILPTVEEAKKWRGETTGLRADGSTFVEDHTLSMADDGGLICTVRDMTERKERAQELQSTSNQLSTLVSNIPAGVLMEDDKRNILFANRELTELFDIGASPDALVGSDCETAAENVKDLFVETDRFITQTTEAVAEHASIWRKEYELVDGRTFVRSGTPFSLDEERAGYIWVYHDVTEQKRAENRFRALFENLPDPTLIAELTEDDTIVREVNAAFEDVFGYSAGHAVDTSLNELIVPPHLEGESEKIDQKVRSGEQLVTEVRRQTANGELRDFLFRSVLIENVEGEPRAHGIYTDITKRKRRERRLKTLHDATRNMMVADTRQEIAQTASRATREILDLPTNAVYLHDEDINGLVPVAVTPDTRDVVGDPPTFREGEGIAWQVFESGEPQVYGDVRTAPAVHNPETPMRSELHLPLGDHGIMLIGSTTVNDFSETDVSLAKVFSANVAIALGRVERKQELQRQNDRLDEFASIVSHDLRNPLNIAQGRLDLAEKTGAREHFETIARAQNRMERIIEDVLTLARQGDAIGEFQPMALDRVARRAWANVETETATLQVDIDRTIDGDASRACQLFENLFRNAIEHGGADVTVRAGWLEKRAGFYVEDSGSGIPPGDRPRVFESGYTTEPEGTGFGLAIVREIAEAHSWEIDVTDGVEGGARFEFIVEAETGSREVD